MCRHVRVSVALLTLCGVLAPAKSDAIDDVGEVSPVLGGVGSTIGASSTPGDPSGDGKVDLNDFGILKQEFGSVAVPNGPMLRADINGDGKVDLTDFGILKQNFGKHSAASAAPEPSAWLLAALAGLGFLALRVRLKR